MGWQFPSTRINPSGQRCLSCSRRSIMDLPIFLVVSWVVVSDNSLSAWLARAAPEKAPFTPLVHAPFVRVTGVATPSAKLAGQNIVCACAFGGGPRTNKLPAPASHATIVNLAIAFRMSPQWD